MGNIIHGIHILQTQACSSFRRSHLRSRVGSRSRMLGLSLEFPDVDSEFIVCSLPLLHDERIFIFLGYDRRIQRAYEGTVVEYSKRRGRDGLERGEEEEKYSSHHQIYQAQNYNSQRRRTSSKTLLVY